MNNTRRGRATTACERCKKKKLRCSSSKPCFGCTESNSVCRNLSSDNETTSILFKKTRRLNQDLNNVKLALMRITDCVSPNASLLLRESLNEINSLLEKIQPQLYLPFEPEEINAYNGTQSIETDIVGKKFDFFNRFSSSNRTLGTPLSVYFGLYSPSLIFSTVGVSWLIKKLLSFSDDAKTRETVYLLLKYFDVASATYKQKYFTLPISPLKHYAELHGLDFVDEKLIGCMINEATDGSPGLLASWERSKQGSRDDKFLSIVQLMELKHLEMIEMDIDYKSLEVFLKQDELLSVISAEFSERLLFSDMHDLGYLKVLISLIENRYWIEDAVFVGRLLCLLCRRSLDCGINRWEYYVHQPEHVADEQRTLWWNCYWWDSWYACTTGKPPLISGEIVCCLFPKSIIDLGVDDSMDVLTLINRVKLQARKTDACILFCRILLAKLITEVFILLHDRRFTDYRIFGICGSGDFSSLVRDLRTEISSLHDVFFHLEEKVLSFLNENSRNRKLFEIAINVKHLCVCCLQSIETLIARIQKVVFGQQEVIFHECLKVSRKQKFNLLKRILLSMLQQRESFQLFKCSWCFFATILDVSSFCTANTSKISPYFLSLVLGVLASYSNIIEPSQNGNNRLANSLEWLRVGFTSSFILVRVCLQTFMNSKGISYELLIAELRHFDEPSSEMAKNLFNLDFLWFENILNNNCDSDFSNEILSHIGLSRTKFTNTEVMSETSLGEFHDSKSSSNNIELHNMQNFLNLDNSLELLDDFWDDIPLDIF